MTNFSRDAFNFRLITEGDLELIHKWLNVPHVAEFWDGPCTLDEVKKKYKRKLSSFLEGNFLVTISDKPFAYISYYKAGKSGNGTFPEEPAGTLGIDQFIALEALLNKGLGSRLIKTFSEWLSEEFSPPKILADPRPDNKRAVRAYEKADFKQRGLYTSKSGPVLVMEKVPERS